MGLIARGLKEDVISFTDGEERLRSGGGRFGNTLQISGNLISSSIEAVWPASVRAVEKFLCDACLSTLTEANAGRTWKNWTWKNWSG